MQGLEPRTQTHPPVYAVPNKNKSHTTRTEQVLADFKEYRQILGDLEKRIKALEEKDARTRVEEYMSHRVLEEEKKDEL